MNHIAGESLIAEINLEISGDVTRAPGCVVAQRVGVTRAEDWRGCCHVQCAGLNVAAKFAARVVEDNRW